MKKAGWVLVGLLSFQQIFSQGTDQESSFVSAEFQGILNLNIISNSQVEFDFKTISDFQRGIIKYNAVTLEVDATMNWDLFAYVSTENWTPVQSGSSDGSGIILPAEILELQSSNPNRCTPTGGNFNSFASIKGLTNSGVSGGLPDANATQFIAGMAGKERGQQYGPGSSKMNPETNQFKINYRLVPGMPIGFPNSTVPVAMDGLTLKGSYTIEVIYALVEDL